MLPAAEGEVVVGGVEGVAAVAVGWSGCGDGLCALASAPLYEMGFREGEVAAAGVGEGAARPLAEVDVVG